MPTPTYLPIANFTATGTVSSITFSGITQQYRDLVVISNNTNGSNNEADVVFRFNGDSGNSYYRIFATGNGSSTGTGAYGPENGLQILLSSTTASTGVVNIMDYSMSDKHKTTISRGNLTTGRVSMAIGRWASTSPITSLTITASGNFVAGSSFALYGVSA